VPPPCGRTLNFSQQFGYSAKWHLEKKRLPALKWGLSCCKGGSLLSVE